MKVGDGGKLHKRDTAANINHKDSRPAITTSIVGRIDSNRTNATCHAQPLDRGGGGLVDHHGIDTRLLRASDGGFDGWQVGNGHRLKRAARGETKWKRV